MSGFQKRADGSLILPGVVGTDSQYFAIHGTLDKQFNSDHDLEIRVREARKRGYNPSPNDVYEPSLARFIGDPEAFVPASGGRGHVKRVVRKRNSTCEGPVTVNDRFQTDPGPSTPLAPDLLKRYVRQKARESAAFRRLSKSDQKASVIEQHAYKR